MYKITSPISGQNISRHGRENLVNELKNLNAERVFFGLGRLELNKKHLKNH